jgi:hypothetical protein
MTKTKRLDIKTNPLAVLFKILANALLEDRYGIDQTAYNALCILAEVIDERLATELRKKTKEHNSRYKYET